MTISNHTSVTEGETAILFCEAAGFVGVGITWTHDGEAITDSSHISITVVQHERLIYQSFLEISNIVNTNAGVYTCIVSNAGTTSLNISTQLTVFCEFQMFVSIKTLTFLSTKLLRW